MAFHRPLDTDGVPAPSRFDEEATAARNRARRQARRAEINYDQFMSISGITYRRTEWRDYCERVGIAGAECIIPTDTLDGWWEWYRVFCADGDAKDQAVGLADSLT